MVRVERGTASAKNPIHAPAVCIQAVWQVDSDCMDGQNDGAEDHVVEAAGLSIIQAGPAPKPPIRPLPSRAICWQLPTQNTVEHQICDEQNKQNYCHGLRYVSLRLQSTMVQSWSWSGWLKHRPKGVPPWGRRLAGHILHHTSNGPVATSYAQVPSTRAGMRVP